MTIILWVVIVLAALWFFAGLLELATEKFYHSPPLRKIDVPDVLLSGTLACPYCKNSMLMDDAIVSCDHCKTFHHYECWKSTGSCSVFGCNSTEETLL